MQPRLQLDQAHAIKGFSWIRLEDKYMDCGWVEFKPGIGLVITVPLNDEMAQGLIAQAETDGVIGRAQKVPE